MSSGIILKPGDYNRPQESRPPCCIYKEGNRVGVFDPILGMCWGIQIASIRDAAPLYQALEKEELWQIDTYVLTDEPAMVANLISRLGRFNIFDYMQGDSFETGIPLLLLPQMAAAMQAVTMVKQMDVNKKLHEAKAKVT